MRKTFLILFAVSVAAWLMIDKVSAQSYNRVSEKNIKVVRGKKLVLTGAVGDGDEVVYRFRARAGQRVTVKIIGRDSDFSVYLNHGLDVEPVANDTKSWVCLKLSGHSNPCPPQSCWIKRTSRTPFLRV